MVSYAVHCDRCAIYIYYQIVRKVHEKECAKITTSAKK